MLDEYLENEGKLIDERAASFSQPPVEPLVYELPTKSTSYVRTLDHILKKQNTGSPASDLISGFIPPSKRPRLTEAKAGRRLERKRGPKPNKPRTEPAAGLGSGPGSAESSQIHPSLTSDSTPEPTLKRRRKFKPKTSSRTLSLHRSRGPSEDMAPLESDSELGQTKDPGKKERQPLMTRALLRQKDLEDSVMWEGRPRTGITEERATIALTSLFTLTGFVSENPTAPIELLRTRAPPACLNEFCRLGCICSSLTHCSRISHCGRLSCMFGCSCLKQKVVLLKNLDGSDCSPPSHQLNSKRRKRRRMKMAYILKEADSVSQPAQRVQTLWKKDSEDLDPESVHVPEAAPQSSPTVRTPEARQKRSSCARVRVFRGKIHDQKEASNDVNCKPARLKSLKQRNLSLKEAKTRTSRAPPGDAVQAPPEDPPQSPAADPTPKPSKRLFIVADCKWESSADQSRVLKQLCEAMAQDRLDRPFKIRKYLISPVSQTVEGEGADSCIQYKVRISRAKPEKEKSAKPVKPAATRRKMKAAKNKQQKEPRQPFDDWQKEVTEEEEEEPLEDWQQEVTEEAELLEDWQREVEEGDTDEEVGSVQPVNDEEKKSLERRTRMEAGTALPFLTGISPAGFLTANKKQPGGTDHPIQVNGKLYPLAKIQLGKMGALHPANRLAAYLTGRVGSSKRQQASPLLSSCKPPQSSAPTSSTSSTSSSSTSSSSTSTSSAPSASSSVSSTSSSTSSAPSASSSVSSTSTRPSTSRPPVAPLIIPVSSTAPQPSSSAVLPVNPPPGSAPPKGQFVMVHVPGPAGQLPPQIATSSPTGQKMVLQLVQTSSGTHYYRRPDGKLVQLVPLSKFKPVKSIPPQAPQKGPSYPSVLPPAFPPTPTAISQQTPPLTTVTPSSSASTSPLSSFSMNTPAAPFPPGSGFLSQKGTCTFKILPSSRDPIVILTKSSSQPPSKVKPSPGAFTLLQPQPSITPAAPVKVISLKPSSGRGAELGVKTVTVSPVSLGSGLVVVRPKTGLPQNPPSKIVVPPPPPPPGVMPALPPPVALEVTPTPNPAPDQTVPEPELASDPVDLDIICVDEETELVTTETQPLDVVDLTSSSETDNSSDCRESDSEDENQPTKTEQRLARQHLEKKRRGELRQLFDDLRKQVGLTDSKTSKLCTLNAAVEQIRELQAIETTLERKKMKLKKRIHGHLWRLAPPSDQTEDDSMEFVDVTDDAIEISSDDESEVEDGGRSVSMEMVKKKRRLKRMRRRSDVSETTGNSPKKLQLHQARQEIQTLHNAMEELKGLKTSLKQQRDAQCSGKSEQRSANQLPAGDPTEGDVTSSDAQPPKAPPTPASAPPTPTPVQPPVQQVLKPAPARPAGSQNAPVQRDRPRTIPNILSRKKTRPPPPEKTTTEEVCPPGESPSFQAVIPAEVLSLVQAALPGQPVLLRPLVGEPTVLQSPPRPGMASVTLNIPNLTNQPLHLTSMPRPPASSAAPLTLANLTDFNMVQVVQPATTQENKQQTKQQEHQTQQQTDKQQQTQQQSRPVDPHLVSVGSDQNSDRPDLRPSSSPSPSPSADCQSQLEGAGPQETRGDPENEILTSLLNEIVFLNQQNVATTAGVASPGKPSDAVKQGGDKERGHAHNSEPDSNSTAAIQTEGAGLNGYAETTGVQPGPGNTKGAVLAPPPLLQMKVGGAKVAPPTSSDGTAGGASAERGEGGVAWRPMPRLVPLGLRGNPP